MTATKPLSRNVPAPIANTFGRILSNSRVGRPLSSMKFDYTKFDGTGRPPRAVQTTFNEFIAANIDEADCIAGQLPVGSGKSGIVRTLQLSLGASAVIPSNILIDQVSNTYPVANFLKGKTHYLCNSGLTCQEWTDECEQEPCASCPYVRSKERAKKEPTFYNPMSLYYFRLAQKQQCFPMLVVDEAHQLPQMLLMLASKKFRRSQYRFDDRCCSEVYLVQWLENLIRRLDKLASLAKQTGDYPKLAELSSELSELGITLAALKEDPQNFAIYIENGTYRGRREQFLNIRPVRVPKNLVQQLLACDKLVLLSGTLFPHDIEDLAQGRTVKFIDLPSPIPKERRPILYRPLSVPMNANTNPRDIISWIESILREFPGRNTIIHSTYAQSARLAPLFNRPILFNTPDNKTAVVEQFKREGGVFLASGCAEGLDLAGDLCRLNISFGLNRPNLGDPVVKKRKALSDGERWHSLETLKTEAQRFGRSTRNETDSSISVEGDPLFARMVKRYHKDLPQSFTESIKWSR